jgi:hypothetical protein
MVAIDMSHHEVEAQGAAGGVRTLLRLEGLALLLAAVALYASTGASWRQFGILFLIPDLSFIGYIAGPRVGAFCYNAMHSTTGPLALALAGFALHQPLILGVALIWLAHVGFDRAMGYGLKYASGFSDTHLGRIGKKRAA